MTALEEQRHSPNLTQLTAFLPLRPSGADVCDQPGVSVIRSTKGYAHIRRYMFPAPSFLLGAGVQLRGTAKPLINGTTIAPIGSAALFGCIVIVDQLGGRLSVKTDQCESGQPKQRDKGGGWKPQVSCVGFMSLRRRCRALGRPLSAFGAAVPLARMLANPMSTTTAT